jgi:ATPase family associated with various cellular activities (AAA)/Winged helix domain, variant
VNAHAAQNWLEANQRHLGAALARVRARLEHQSRHLTADGKAKPAIDGHDAGRRSEDDAAMAPPAALQALTRAFGLSDFERDILLLCAGVELDSQFGALLAALAGDAHRRQATFGLALAVLPDPHWSALAPMAPLRRWRLVEFKDGDGLTASALRIDERILHYLTGVSYLDDRLQGIVEPVAQSGALLPSQQKIAERIAAIWHDRRGAWPSVQLCGPEQGAKAPIAAAACAGIGLGLLRLNAIDLPTATGERLALARLCDRELLLGAGALLLDCHGIAPGDAAERAVISFAEEILGPVVIAGRDALSFTRGLHLRLDVPRPATGERHALWQSALGPLAAKLNGKLDGLMTQFPLDEPEIRAAVLTGVNAEDDSETVADGLWDACRQQARTPLAGLAQRIEPVARWSDLVLPEAQLELLREIAVHVRRSATVYETWGFANKGARGLGIGALFAGASGTGKTMAAEVLANELRLDLFHIDLSQVVNKYIGETEKNLRRIFDAAERSRAILLFDEADALFGKRSEVKDSHDRYANIEVSYLLQRMETYRGLAILTTNMKSALDAAFLRRLRFVVQFPFPDAAQRAEIWRRVFPAETPTKGLDVDLLARLNLPGGNIRGIALNAAFLAADEGAPVGMAHLKRAARSEYAKLEKPLTASEIGGWE